MGITVLLVEDDSELAGSLADFLIEVGFDVDFAFNGQACLELCRQNHYDVLVMDVNMPQMDGLSACQELRQNQGSNTPIIFLTARDTLEDKLAGFDAGADDYLVKPFAPAELAARLNVLANRQSKHSGNVISLGDIEIDRNSQQLRRQGEAIELHHIQFRLLEVLAQYAPAAVSREILEKELWQGEPPNCDALRTHVYRLRMALDKPYNSNLIKTIHGKGYRLAIPN
ncbi:response regulator transcription factor [Pseudoteredinibacter isoporae]|uniref:DNA-binding response OmpR family regulator n=1 Tax=Pseudoteredinibacter isoporae TaxID=570281 RepID=A0A7X0JRL4_9GAMM|nr:response regulator transcription factor [Pseudoteredinibacter isoporae]MBB6520076.1 DNA-binding response OmpR family regulator [Pseudoteredinibacter isoporae]NHO85648.1 response regulator transcription factor [Pseudoteredinibacter isoporae]NIB25900.1 response regulator transcription factor [Pseudoteredinibacter isoporae]